MKVLIADDDPKLRKVLANELAQEGLEVHQAESGDIAIDQMENDEFDVLLLDLSMPGLSGMEVLKRIADSGISVEVVVLTAYATVSTAVEAMKLGAYDYLTKPFKLQELRAVIQRASERKRLVRENLLLKMQIRRQSQAETIITRSPLMLAVLEDVRKVAASDLPVLIYGETGVGKELVAKAVHEASGRIDGPFIPINCGAIPENMLESEIFGHEKGAFTGAHARKPGLLEMADSGVLFLDEVGDLSPPLQGKLLRVIETGIFFRIGGIKEVRADAKFVSATNKDLRAEVDKGTFRQDLYYRISALTLRVPPLRERKEDIPLLVDHIVRSNPTIRDKKFSQDALAVLSENAWPGNVRELQNVVHRTLLLSNKVLVGPQDLPGDLVAGRRTPTKRLEDVEREHILAVLNEAGGQRGKAAEILGVDPKTLYRKLLSYGVDG